MNPAAAKFWIPSASAAGLICALAAVGGALGPKSSAGFITLLVSANALFILLMVVQPILLGRAHGPAARARSFDLLERGLKLTDLDEISDAYYAVMKETVGASRAFLILHDETGTLFIHGGEAADGEALGEWGGDLNVLRGSPPLVWRHQLVAGDPSLRVQTTVDLMDALGCSFLFVLSDRERVVGVATAAVERYRPEHDEVLATIYAHLSALVITGHVISEIRAVAESLELATPMQEALMPPAKPLRCHGIDIFGAYQPADACGGDLWTWCDLGAGKLLLFVSDATGHGAPPAMLAVTTKGVVEAHAMVEGADLDLERLLRVVDRRVRLVGRSQYFMTAVAAVIDVESQQVTLANAGHNFPFWVDEAGRVRHIVGAGDLLGRQARAKPELHTLPIMPGARLVLYTDGVTDAVSARGQAYGNRRFHNALSRAHLEPPKEVAEGLLLDLFRHIGGRPLDDDVTLVVVAFPTGDEDSLELVLGR